MAKPVSSPILVPATLYRNIEYQGYHLSAIMGDQRVNYQKTLEIIFFCEHILMIPKKILNAFSFIILHVCVE